MVSLDSPMIIPYVFYFKSTKTCDLLLMLWQNVGCSRVGTASFNDGDKIGRKFACARAKWESWRELLLGENYLLTSRSGS